MANQPKSFGARALGAFALLLSTPHISGCATGIDAEYKSALTRDADYAIYVARITSMDFRALPECPEGYICLNVEYDLKLDPIEYLAGNPAVGRQTFRVYQHSRYRNGVALMVHVNRTPEGEWKLVNRQIVSIEGCLGEEALKYAPVINDSDSEWWVDEEDGEDGRACFSRSFRPAGGNRR